MPSTKISSEDNRPVLGVYSHIYLDKVEKHVYRQITGITGFDIHVFYQELKNVGLFPFRCLHSVTPARGPGGLGRLWRKHVRHESPFVYRGYETQLLEDLKHFEVDVLHIYFGHYGVELLSVFDKLTIPVIVSFHGKDATAFFNDASYARKAREMFQKAALIFVRADHMGDCLIRQGCPAHKIRVTRAALDLTQFPFTPKPKPQSGPVTFLQACRLIPKKGLETLLHAFSQVIPDFPEARLEIVGSGPLEDTLKQLIAKLNLGQSVTMRGYLETPALIAAMQDADVFIHPSESDNEGNMEGIPNAIIEAMALGRPVIATTHAGIPELITNEVNGLLVPERDPKSLAEAMRHLLNTPERWSSLTEAGRRAVEEQHELCRQMERLEGFYREAMASGTHPRVLETRMPQTPVPTA
jgi:colanic acid/amylovoran biosynthesis glycosyltransferase